MRLPLFTLLALTPLALTAQTVTESQARIEAQEFLQTARQGQKVPSRDSHNSQKAVNLSLVRKGLAPESKKPAYYVYSAGQEDEGFVIVSADSRSSHRILGYSASGTITEGNIPENVQAWLDIYAGEVDVIEKTNAVINEGTGMEDAVGNVVVAPLITTQWGQDAPFNDKCPKKNGERTQVGCIPVAAGQIMNYYRWPRQAKGYVEYEWNSSWIEKDFTECSYDYDNLNVSEFLYDIALGSQTDFNLAADGGSGAYELNMGRALINYFDYDKSMQLHYRGPITMTIDLGLYNDYEEIPAWDDEAWDDMLRKELDARRPILYSGSYRSGKSHVGHEFICDGYDDAGYFHFNWGWAGYCDGWYVTTSLYPEYADSRGYNLLQSAFFGLKPDEGGKTRYLSYGSLSYIWGLPESVNVLYCLENEESHSLYYGQPKTCQLPPYSYCVKYEEDLNGVPDEFPQKKDIPAGTYRKYLVCNEPGTNVYQPVSYGYASDKAELAETFTWVDIDNDGVWTESSSRSFSTKSENNEIRYYVTKDNEVKITYISSSDKSPEVPASVSYRGQEYTVTEIDCSSIWNITPKLPETIRKMTVIIGADLPVSLPPYLEELSLSYAGTQLTLPSTLKVLSLWNYKGTELTLPSSLTALDGLRAPELTELVIPASVCRFAEKDNSFSAEKLKTLIFKEGCSVKKIRSYCFEGCTRLSKVVLSNGLEEIGEYAFSRCGSLKELSFPQSMRLIGARAFWGCTNLADIIFDDNARLEEIDEFAFGYCENLEQMSFPANLKVADNIFYGSGTILADFSKTQIEDVRMEFYDCKSLRSVILPNTVKTITILGTGQMKSLVVPQGVTTIENLVCDKLQSLTLPASLKAFNSSSLGGGAKVICEASTPPEGTGLTCMARSGKYYRDIDLYIPAGATEAYQSYRYTLPRGSSEYYYFSPLTEMVSANTPVNIIADAGGATVMGNSSTGGVLEIPESVNTTTGAAQVRTIGDYAFYGTNLAAVDIPASVGVAPAVATRTLAAETGSGIGSYAFAYCPSLQEVMVHWDKPLPIQANTFEGIDLSGCKLYVPADAISAYRQADVWKEFGEICGIGTPLGVETPSADDAETNAGSPAPAFNLAGQQVTDAHNGIVIINGAKYLNF